MIKYNTHIGNSELKIFEFGHEKCSKDKESFNSLRNMYLLHYIFDGTGKINGKTFCRGDVVISFPNQVINFSYNSENPWEYYWIGFSGKEADYIVNSFPFDDGISAFKFKRFKDVADIFSDIMCVPNFSSNMYCQAKETFYKLMAISSINNDILKSEQGFLTMPELHVQKALEFMKNNCHRSINLTDIANYLGVNKQYMCNIFLKQLGLSPQHCLIELRLHKACTLMQDGRLSISDVAYSVGYNDIAGFSRAFKKKMKLSPKNWIKNYVANNKD